MSAQICPKCNERYGAQLTECPKDGAPLADAQVADAMLGRTLGNFKVERILGAGGMGMVFLARHKTIGQQAVVKVLSPEMLRLRDAKTRFLNEAKLSSAVNHPNIVRIFDFGETPDDLVYMIMEFVPGEDLEQILKVETRIDAVRAARIMRQVSSALEAAHTAFSGPVIHRDLKPANIRLAQKGREEHATVLDFGIAKATEAPGNERLTQAGTVIGTPRYMAPEQACGDPVDARTDIYALGVIAYELVTGHTPYQTSRLIELISRQLHVPVPPIKPELNVPKAYADIVMRCLQAEPQKRFQSAGELCEAFDRFLQDVAAARIRRRATLGIGAALALGLLVAGAVYVLRPSTPAQTRVLELRSLLADGKNVTSAPTIYVRGERARLEGVIGGLEPLAAVSPEVSVAVDGTEAPLEARKDGFAAFLGPLAAGKRANLTVAVSFGEPGKRKRVAVLERPIVRDVTPPALSVRPMAGTPYRLSKAGILLFRDPHPSIEIGIDEAGEVAANPVSVRVDPPVRATAGAPGGGSVRIGLDLSGLGPAEPSLVVVAVADAADNEGSLRIPVICDRVPPELSVAGVEGAEPEAGAGAATRETGYLVRAAGTPLPREVRVSVRASDPNGVEGIALEVAEASSEGAALVGGVDAAADWKEARFSVSLREEGRYRLRITATDGAGNATSTALALRCVVPLVVDLEPLGGRGAGDGGAAAAVAAREVAIEGRANKPLRAVEVTREAAGEEPLTVAAALKADGAGARFSATVPLAAGLAQALSVRVTPERGEGALERLEVVQDGVPPSVVIAKPGPWPDRFPVAALEDGAIVFERKVDDALSGVARASVRAFGFKTEAEAASAAAAIEAGGLEAAAAAAGGIELPVQSDGAVSRVRPAGAPEVVIAIEAFDRAGNRTTLVKRARVESHPPILSVVPRLGRVRLHDPIVIEIGTGKPVVEVKVNGSTDGVRKTGETAYIYEATMFLDSPLTHRVEATDAAGNSAVKEAAIERENACMGPTDEVPVPIDAAALERAYHEYGPAANHCPNCGRPVFSGRKAP